LENPTVGETVHELLASELHTPRVCCKHCQGVVEVPIAAAARAVSGTACKVCGRQLLAEDQADLLAELAELFEKLAGRKKHVEVQFVARAGPPGP
jgi:hypothetical protein